MVSPFDLCIIQRYTFIIATTTLLVIRSASGPPDMAWILGDERIAEYCRYLQLIINGSDMLEMI